MSEPANTGIAGRLDEVAGLLADQGANPSRVRAYRRAAVTLPGVRAPCGRRRAHRFLIAAARRRCVCRDWGPRLLSF
jgi:helix-hairpin-helix protein